MEELAERLVAIDFVADFLNQYRKDIKPVIANEEEIQDIVLTSEFLKRAEDYIPEYFDEEKYIGLIDDTINIVKESEEFKELEPRLQNIKEKIVNSEGEYTLNIELTEVLSNDADFENKHKRNPDGTFAKKEGSSETIKSQIDRTEDATTVYPKDGTGKIIDIEETELNDDLIDIKELRKKAENYFDTFMDKKTIEKEGIGKITMIKRGFDEYKSRSAYRNKIKALPAVMDIIRNGKVLPKEENHKKRHDDLIAFYPIVGKVKLNNEIFETEILITQGKDNKFFYELFIGDYKRIKKVS